MEALYMRKGSIKSRIVFFSVGQLRTSDKQIPVNPVVVADDDDAVVVKDSCKKIKTSRDQTVQWGSGVVSGASNSLSSLCCWYSSLGFTF